MYYLNFFWKNRQSFIFALFLSVGVWVSTVILNDPNVQQVLSEKVELEIIGQSDDFVVISNIPAEIDLEILAPKSIWDEVNQSPHLIEAKLDLTGYEKGVHVIDISVIVDAYPVQIINFSPSILEVQIEKLQSGNWPIRTSVIGEPALGYQANLPTISSEVASLSGPESLISIVDKVVAEIDISGARESITNNVQLIPYDVDGNKVTGIDILPEQVTVKQEITQSGGYRDVAVIVETRGDPEKGYRVTNISVSPPTVTLFSSDPLLVAEMPGFISTLPLDLTNSIDDIEAQLTLDLQDGITLVGDNQAITVQISIAAIEDTIMLEIPVEIIGLGPSLSAELSPSYIEVFLSGPYSVLNALLLDDIHIFVNLQDYEVGTYLVAPEQEVIPTRLTLEGINPDTIEVIIADLVAENNSGTNNTP
jgi:YbbR domain-containing protein